MSTDVAFEEGHALVIGVGTYKVSAWDATVTSGDGQAVYDTLVDQRVAGYPPEQVRFLHDETATLAGVRRELGELATRATAPDAVVLIFYAGHGVLDDHPTRRYTLTTHDTTFDPSGFANQGTGLSEDELVDAVALIPAQKVLVILNACLSGRVGALGALGAEGDGGAARPLGSQPSAALTARMLGSGEGRAVINAARATQSSYFLRSATTTFFGQALVDGLRGKGMSGPGYVGLFDLYLHLYRSVIKAVVGIGPQEPMLQLRDGVGPFPLAIHLGEPGTPGALADRSALGPPSILQSLPPDVPVERVPVSVVQSVRNTTVGDFSHATAGVINVGDIAGRDIVKITVTTTLASASAASSHEELLQAIAATETAVGELKVDEGRRKDVGYELREAREALEKTPPDPDRAAEKLDATQRLLLTLSAAVPEALPLSEAVGRLLTLARQHA